MRFIGKTIGGMQTSISNDGLIYVVSDDLYIENVTQDKDIIFKTNDGGTATEVMRIDGSTSNVGIGTSSPSAKFHINVDSEDNQPALLIEKVSDNNETALVVKHISLSNIRGIADFQNTSGSVMKILADGNVGIGTTSPSQALDVFGNIKMQNNDALMSENVAGGTRSLIALGSDNVLRIKGNDSEGSSNVISMVNGGNVGIGTTSPAHKLDVAGGAQFNTTTGATPFYITRLGATDQALSIKVMDDNVRFESIQDETADNYGGFDFRMDGGTTEPDFVIRKNAGNPILNVKGDGNVGIGTTSPGRKLQVDNSSGVGEAVISGTTGATLYFRPNTSYSAAGNFGIFTTGLTSGTYESTMDFKGYYNGVTTPLTIKGSGNVGIGTTSPASKLHVAGTVQVGVDDTGHDVKFFGATSGRYMMWDESADALFLVDNVQLRLGTGGDLNLYHTGTGSVIQNSVGNLTIQQDQNDGDIIFRSDDGSGGTTEYFRLDGGGELTYFRKHIQLADSQRAYFGSIGDLSIHHDGSNSYVDNITGDFYIRNKADDKDIIFQSDDGSGGLATYFYLDGSLGGGTWIYTRFPDHSVLGLGDNIDLRLYHDGTNNYVQGRGGDLIIENQADDKDIILKSDDGSGGYTAYLTLDGGLGFTQAQKKIRFIDDVAAEFGSQGDFTITHNGSHLTMNNSVGNITIRNYTDDGDIVFQSDDGSGGTTPYLTLDGSETKTIVSQTMEFQDNVKLAVGNSEDLIIDHNATNSRITNYTGNLRIINSADDADITFECDDGSGGVKTYFYLDGSIGTTIFPDSTSLGFGTGGDMYINHDATNSNITNFTGDLYITNRADDKDIILQSDDGSGGYTPYLTLDGSAGYTTVQKNIRFENNVQLQVGTSGNGGFLNDGTNTVLFMGSGGGHLYIRQDVDNSDIVFQCDDGSGGRTAYLTIDGGDVKTYVHKDMKFNDNVAASFGNNDFQILHDGTNTRLYNYTGNMQFINYADDADIIFQSDDGSGGVTTYFQLDGSDVVTLFSKPSRHIDNVKAMFGNSNDLSVFHDATDSRIQNAVGDLYITNTADDKDVIFRSDDGSGGVTAYLTLDGSAGHTVANKEIHFLDNVLARFGSTNDFAITHNGTNTTFENNTGNLVFSNYADDSDILFQSDDGSGGVAIYTMLDGSEGRISTKVNNRFDDGARLELGTSGDLDLYHDGSNSYIDQNGTGNLYIRNTQEDGLVYLQSNYNGSVSSFFYLHGAYSSSNPYTIFPDNSIAAFGNAADLRMKHDGSNSYIQQTGTGDLYIQQHVDDRDIVFQADDGSGGLTAYLTLDGSAGHSFASKNIRFLDSVSAVFGTGSDMYLYHDGSNSFIRNDTGNLTIFNNTNDGDIIFQSDDGSGGVQTYLTIDGGLEVVTVPDTIYLGAGNSFDLSLRHDGSNSHIQNNTGDLTIKNTANDKDIIFQSDDGSGGVEEYFRLDGSAGGANPVTIFPDNSYIHLGSGQDMVLGHTGSDTYFTNNTGDLYIQNKADDKDIIFQSDDGSGGVTAYLTLDGGAGTVEIAKATNFANNVTIQGSSDSADGLHLKDRTFVAFSDAGSVVSRFRSSASGVFQLQDGSYNTGITLKTNATSTFTGGGITVGVDDTGHDVKFFGATSGKYLLWDESDDSLNLTDSTQLKIGAAADLRLYHDGSDSYLRAYGTTDLIIMHDQADRDIKFKADDGSGGTETYFFLDGSTGRTIFPDSKELRFGTGSDLNLYHDGSNSYVVNNTGNLLFYNNTDDGDIIFQSDDGSGGTTAYLTLDGSETRIVVAKAMRFNDSTSLQLGSDADIQIHHDGSNGFFNNITGDLTIKNSADDKDIIFQSDDGSGGIETYFFLDGSASSGNPVTCFPDNSAATWGDGYDLILQHNGTNSEILNQIGNLTIKNFAADKDIIFQCDDGSGGETAYLTLDGSAAETKVDKDMRFSDNVNLRIGTNSDVVIVHDNSNFTTTNYTGNYNIINQQLDGDIVFQTDDGSGGVETYLTIDGGSQEIIATKPIVTGETQIKVLPHHFMSNEDGGANKSAQFRDDTIIGVRTSADSAELYAFVEIPYGKTARTVTVYGNDTSLVVNVYESDINAGALTDKTPGAGCVVGTECDITDVAYSATNYLVIKVTTVSYTNDIVYGAVVTIG